MNERVLVLLKHLEGKSNISSEPVKTISKKKTLKKTSEVNRSRQVSKMSKASGLSAAMTRSQYEDNNPFLRVAKLDKKMGNQPNTDKRSSFLLQGRTVMEPLFNKECEQALLYRQLIDEDKLENQNIQEFFKMNHHTLPQHLLLLFMAHIDDLMTIMGPQQSIEFVLPIYFIILNINSIYHCNFKNINLDRRPVKLKRKF